jgi:hypothetical protein
MLLSFGEADGFDACGVSGAGTPASESTANGTIRAATPDAYRLFLRATLKAVWDKVERRSSSRSISAVTHFVELFSSLEESHSERYT